jgi:hypothetical protein
VEQTGSTAEKEEVAAVGQRGVDAEEEELVGAMSGDVGYQEVPCAEMLDIKRCHVRRCWIARGAMCGDVGYQEVPCAEMLDIKTVLRRDNVLVETEHSG